MKKNNKKDGVPVLVRIVYIPGILLVAVSGYPGIRVCQLQYMGSPLHSTGTV